MTKIKSKKGRWIQVFFPLFLFVFATMVFRYAVFEPFLIPSSSMEPTLLVQDYILVEKASYGWRMPFSKKWITGPSKVGRGDVVVFRSVDDDSFFMVKRVVGLPGDKIEILSSKKLRINGKNFKYEGVPTELSPSFTENNSVKSYTIQLLDPPSQLDNEEVVEDYVIQKGRLFVMGDNRDRSSDSRFWGTLPVENLLGKASRVAISCDGDSEETDPFCPQGKMRWERLATEIR